MAVDERGPGADGLSQRKETQPFFAPQERCIDVEQDQLRDEAGVVFVVRRVVIDYLAPARFNDLLDVSVRLLETGRASIDVEQDIAVGPTRLAYASVKLVCVDAARFKPAKIPADLFQQITRQP